MKRVGIFLDLSNLYYCALNKHKGRKINYQNYYDYCETIGEITHAVAYGAQVKTQARGFIYAMEKIGFECKYKTPKKIHTNKGIVYKADWDVGMVIDIINIILGVGLDIVVLGTADGDMAPFVHWCTARGVKVIVLACGISYELKDATPHYVEAPESLLEEERK